MENKNLNPEDQQKNNNSGGRLASALRSFDNIAFFRTEWLIPNIPYFLFIVALGFFYIWNNHRGVSMVKEMRETEEQMIDVQWYYNAAKDSLTRHSRQSTVAQSVESKGMQELSNPPFTIIEK